MRYISTTLCHFYFIPSISLLLRETMPTRFPRLRLPHHTMSANKKKIPATMKPNIFTLSFFITPHHTLLLIPAHNPPPRSFTPATHNPAPHHFTAPSPAHHNPAHYLATLTPYISLFPPLLITTLTHYLTTLTPYTLLLSTLLRSPNSLHFTALTPDTSQPRPTTLQLSLPPLYCSYPCHHTPAHYLTTLTPYTLLLPPLLITTLTHYLTTLTPYTSQPDTCTLQHYIYTLQTLHPPPTALNLNPSLLPPLLLATPPTTLQLSPPPLPYSYPCSSQLLPTTSQPSLPPLTYSRPCSSQLYTHPLQPSISTISLLFSPPYSFTPTTYNPHSRPFPCSHPCSSQPSPTT